MPMASLDAIFDEKVTAMFTGPELKGCLVCLEAVTPVVININDRVNGISVFPRHVCYRVS